MSNQPKTLPARYYTDPEVFQQELENLFCQMWVCVGRTEQASKHGDFFLCEIAGESIIVTRDGDVLRGFYNVCRHRGTRVCREQEGKFAGPIRCPYHGWSYGLDGKLVGRTAYGRVLFSERSIRCTQSKLTSGMDSSFLTSTSTGCPMRSRSRFN